MLYIKRAEQYHTRAFITEAFASNDIGVVKDVRFIKKSGDYGNEYNGVVVIFTRWNMNARVKRLFDDMSHSQDGTAKFIYDQFSGRYWFVNVYKAQFQEYEEITTIDTGLSDKEKIKELELLVKSMAAQMHYMQTRQEKTEAQLMEAECEDTQSRLYNSELHYQFEDYERERQMAEDELQEQIHQLRQENELLRDRNTFISIDLLRKEKECEELKQSLYEERNILDFVQIQANEMKDMLKDVSGLKQKMTIEELID
jgi:hypothetical protein